MNSILPLGKLPVELQRILLSKFETNDPQVLLGPGVGLDCAIIDLGEKLFVFKSDPITFLAENIGWYAVQINANDIATTGARPRWMMATLLLPEGKASPEMAIEIASQLSSACAEIGASVIGGHTEVTYGLDRPILLGTMIGEVMRDQLITPQGARPGDKVLMTKSVPIEATAILAREYPEVFHDHLTNDELEEAQNFLYRPGISINKDAQIALRSGHVTAMHDPTEGGLASALWELAEACGATFTISSAKVPILPVSARICQIAGIDPLSSIASGALLFTASSDDADNICLALKSNGIPCTIIGDIETGPAKVIDLDKGLDCLLNRPPRDEIAKFFENVTK